MTANLLAMVSSLVGDLLLEVEYLFLELFDPLLALLDLVHSTVQPVYNTLELENWLFHDAEVLLKYIGIVDILRGPICIVSAAACSKDTSLFTNLASAVDLVN